jgi:hypothetical protein
MTGNEFGPDLIWKTKDNQQMWFMNIKISELLKETTFTTSYNP